MRLADRLAEALLIRAGEEQVPHGHDLAGVVENSHDDLLAPHRGQSRHAKVDGSTLVSYRQAAVLRLALLGDVDRRHDLQPRDDAVLNRPVGLLHLVQHTVDAEPDAQLLLARLDVDVARAVVDGLSDQEVDEAHDRSVVVLILERLGHRRLGRLGRLLDRRRELAQLLIRAQEPLEHLRERVLGDDHRLDEQVGDAGDVIERDDVGGVQDANRQPLASPIDGDQLESAAQIARHQSDDARVERHARQIYVPMPRVQRDRLSDLGLGHHLRTDQKLLELGPLADLRDGRRHLRGTNRSGEHKRLRESSHVNSPIPLLILGAHRMPVVKSPKTATTGG